MKKILIATALLAMVGCASPYKNASYTDKSTPDERNIEATGAAAVEAARANRSTNVSSTGRNVKTEQPIVYTPLDQYDMSNGRRVVYKPNGERDHRAELRLLQLEKQHQKPGYGDYASDRMSDEFDYRMKRKIDAEVQRFMDKLF